MLHDLGKFTPSENHRYCIIFMKPWGGYLHLVDGYYAAGTVYFLRGLYSLLNLI